MKLIAFALLTAIAAPVANAQTVYRCGDTYSQTPCAQAKAIEVGDARTAAQQTEARRVVADERRLAADMRRDRLADEHATKSTGAASLGGQAPATKPKSIARPFDKKKHGTTRPPATTDFVAYDPASRKRRRGA